MDKLWKWIQFIYTWVYTVFLMMLLFYSSKVYLKILNSSLLLECKDCLSILKGITEVGYIFVQVAFCDYLKFSLILIGYYFVVVIALYLCEILLEMLLKVFLGLAVIIVPVFFILQGFQIKLKNIQEIIKPYENQLSNYPTVDCLLYYSVWGLFFYLFCKNLFQVWTMRTQIKELVDLYKSSN